MCFVILNNETANATSLNELAEQKNQAIKIYEQAVQQQEEASNKIIELQNEIDSISLVLDDKEDKLAKVVRSSYTSNTSEFKIFLESIFSDSSLNDVLRNLEYYDRIIEEQNNLVNEVKIEKQKLDNNKAELERQKEEIDTAVIQAEEAKNQAEEAYEELKKEIASQIIGGNYNGEFPQGWLTVSQLKFHGRVEANGFSYTYYSETVLPGGGLNIPGRHTESCGCVCDGDGYVVVANDVLDRGGLVPTPLICHPVGKIYDCGVGNSSGIDIYVH